MSTVVICLNNNVMSFYSLHDILIKKKKSLFRNCSTSVNMPPLAKHNEFKRFTTDWTIRKPRNRASSIGQRCTQQHALNWTVIFVGRTVKSRIWNRAPGIENVYLSGSKICSFAGYPIENTVLYTWRIYMVSPLQCSPLFVR